MRKSSLIRRMKRSRFPKTRNMFAVLLFVVFSVFIYRLGISISETLRITGLDIVTVKHLIFDTGADLRESSGFTNVLVLGMSGSGHAGADLTDTIMLLAINPQLKKMFLISVPRDIWSDTLKDKVNSAYHYGEVKKPGDGLILAKSIIEEITDIPVHYAIAVDFAGFKNFIDQIGGIDLDVKNAFTDMRYPVSGKENDDCGGDPLYKCRYLEVKFTEGLQHMDGERALVFVRSRNARGEEGTDFARGRRQQQVLAAVKDKLMEFSEMIKLERNKKLYRTAIGSIHTDLKLVEMLTLARIISRINDVSTKTVNIDNLFYDLEGNSLYGGKYVLLPNDSLKAVGNYIRGQLGLSQ